MRPNSLEVEGLTCFRDKQKVDFSRLDLFAITGPTGAGKSTLLEAMVLALYGELPRVDEKHRRQLISLGSAAASVVLDFNVGTDRYRIQRKLRQRGPAEALLEKHDGTDFTEVVAEQVRPVDAAILRLLRLSAGAFKQAVLLPQGEFATFLKAEPKKRGEMLGSLLGVGVYERMRGRAHSTAVELRATVENHERVLNSEYQGVSAEGLTSLESSRDNLTATVASLRTEREATQGNLSRLSDQFKKTDELGARERRLTELQVDAANVAALRSGLEAARRAEPVVPLLDQAELAARNAATAAETAAQAARAATAATAEATGKESARAAAELAAAAVPGLRSRVELLNRVVGQADEARLLVATLDRQRVTLAALAADLGNANRDLEAAQSAVKASRPAVEAARKKLEGVGYDAELEATLETARSEAQELRASRKKVATLVSAESKRRKELDEATAALLPLEKAATAAKDSLEEASKVAAAAQDAVTQAQVHNAANHLREGLKPGDPCPVCDRKIERRLGDSPDANVKKAEKARDAAALRKDEATAGAQAAKDALGEAKTAVKAAKTEHTAAHQAVEAVSAEIAKGEGGLRSALGQAAASAGAHVDEWVLSQLDALAKLRNTHAKAQAELQRAEKALERAAADQARAEAFIGDRSKSQTTATAEIAAGEQRLAELRAKIAAVIDSNDPEKDAADAGTKIRTLEGNLRSAESEAQAARQNGASATEAAKVRAAAADEARAAAVGTQKRRDEEVAAAGFPTPDATRAAVLPAAEVTRRAERVTQHDQEKHSAEERIAALKAELGPARVSRESLDAAAQEAKALNVRFEALHGELNKVEMLAEQMRERLARSRSLQGELEQAEGGLRIYERLAADLKANELQEYVLREAFVDLVRCASLHLMRLTQQRYSLAYEDEAIWVLDYNNDGEKRITDTLSGGETFLASLALALELSEAVQREAGLVRLDSLFIDEGFGSLDPDTLAVATDALHDLQVGGRMVGIISHVLDLKDAFPQQVVVTKHQEGFSTVEVRTPQDRVG